ncbi:sce7725 family protein [Catalinimonas niigatensis]|uniref:sce7725 family protein n=1 Tax=Catalinimonas niigatensis TaxID=1397264 RepID=UPI0026658123|nr:sce7725 family protein [Catalinimonas niigatensis]WPP48355.1 sce7725 family protein [Catalinimonas niigatensis]
MYLPYLRGKQYELIALRELCDTMAANREKISPIIEPVKDSSTFKSCIDCLAQQNINFTVIINPSVGDLKDSHEHTKTIIGHLSRLPANFNNWQLGVLIDSNFNFLQISQQVLDLGFEGKKFTLIHNVIRRDIENILTRFNSGDHVEFNVINYTHINDRRRYHRKFARDTIVSLDDFFLSQPRNADYRQVGESEFSEEHVFYREDGFRGFSDFLTIGEPYSDGGFLPYAVAIHITYEDNEGVIRVKHFTSISNEDASDVGGKFAEALEELINWCDEGHVLETKAVEEFRSLHTSGHFPGLGVIKKLSIMHHIELILNLIET